LENLITFLENSDIEKSAIFSQLKCSLEEANILKNLTHKYIEGCEEVTVLAILKEIYTDKNYIHIKKVYIIKNLLESGWLTKSGLANTLKKDISGLELLHSNISLSSTFLKLLENNNPEVIIPNDDPYTDHLEYLKDQFTRIELYQKLSAFRNSFKETSPNITALKHNLSAYENTINKKISKSKCNLIIEEIALENELSEKEKIIFLALLKEEYSSDIETLRDMNTLIDLISQNEYDKIKNRALLEEGSKLIENSLVDFDEMLTAFGGVTRSFYISEEVIQKIIRPTKDKKEKKIKLSLLIKEQEIFELIEPKTSLDDVILHPKTQKILNNLLKRMDKKVLSRLKEWGIIDRKKGLSSKIIFYGPSGTGKTMTALSLSKSLRKSVLNFDCSKILSQYVGESEKNVRKIFDTYYDLSKKTKSSPVLLLNEADQFLSSRTSGGMHSTDKMHNQMQNIFLEQIENFNGILIATTNLLENIDPAFSRRFDYKIEFKKPDFSQRLLLFRNYLPENAVYEENFSIEELAKYPLTGGQIKVIIKNTALNTAVKDEPIFTMSEFKNMIDREIKGTFGEEKLVGFVS
jgi:SpoVK/Ycf46/Vps4 family AAA+-type ATPase